MNATRALLLAAGLCVAAGGSRALPASSLYCDANAARTPAQQDRLLRFAAIARQALAAAGPTVALVSRSGLDLQRFGIRYSHAGLGLAASENAPWSVRQLYYACDEGRPRLFDQGLAGFVMGTDNPALGYLSIVLLPPAAAAEVERTALDKARALRLLAATYSANAHPYSLRYQNCNQWLVELLATAWGGLPDGEDLRPRAQAWLAAQGYAPPPVAVGSHALMFAGQFIPWVHFDDHPEDDRYALRLRVSLPAAIEAFVRQRVPDAQRMELCHDERQVVVRHGWRPLGEGCVAELGDRVVVLD
ncbi:MAG: DUF2145 domain-containing protein [Burkholderiales bacterium]|nr:DUF2145 domain-containing protein [Burkholderiales bacterium]